MKENKPTLEQSEGYVSNVKRIRETFPFVPDLPEAPSDMQSFTFQEANNLEKILVQVEPCSNGWINPISWRERPCAENFKKGCVLVQDAIMKGNGNSRYLKTVGEALSLYPNL